ncbi:hypothetical protein [Arthrobacter sp. lap29]|uniref:hypothetical protein n=1 Tax=Arthrobacter sp. lap29 TaxID=3056122 RepID=UPI0028F7067D|nr:hypothetical protein [Arthrobacter sp. lap29]
MRQLGEATRRFVARHIVADDPYPELSRLDLMDRVFLEVDAPSRFGPCWIY